MMFRIRHLPVLVHCERSEHDLKPCHRLSEEQFSQRRVASYFSSDHVTVDLEVDQALRRVIGE